MSATPLSPSFDSRPISLTGDRPTGPLHLGHLVGSLRQRVAVQDTHRSFVMLADGQALTDHIDRRDRVQEAIRAVLLDYLAVGLDPERTTIFVQSMVPELFELAFHFMPMVTVAQLERNPTIRKEIGQKYRYDTSLPHELVPRHIPMGFLAYPVSQAADILAFDADVVPVGDDQVPMIEQANRLAERFNALTGTSTFKTCQPMLSSVGRLMGMDGQEKMGKSLGNAFPLSASSEEVKRLVRGMYTDPNHLKVSDPGRVEGNAVFAYLDALHPEPAEVEAMKAHYRRGGLGDSAVKAVLIQTLEDLLAPMRERRAHAEASLDLEAIVLDGTARARAQAKIKLDQVRDALGVGRSALRGLRRAGRPDEVAREA